MLTPRNFRTNKKDQNSTTTTFWQKLENDIERINKKAINNAQNFRKMQYTTSSQRNHEKSFLPEANIPIAKFSTIYKRNKAQQQEEKRLQNKLHYLQVDHQRKNKTVQLARKKYEKIVEIRHQTIQQKANLQKNKQRTLKSFRQEAEEKIKRVRLDRQRKSLSVKSFCSETHKEASNIRAEHYKNIDLIRKHRNSLISDNKRKVQSVHVETERSRVKLKSLQTERQLSGKKNYQFKTSTQYFKFQQRERRNSVMLEKLKKQAKKINKDKARFQEQLKSYQQFLGLDKKKQFIPHNNISRNSTSRSFYITTHQAS